MKKRKIIGLGLAVVLVYFASAYFNNKNTSSYDGLLSAIASCGNFIQSSFKSIQRSQIDYAIVLMAVITVIATLFYSIKYLVKPNEGADHIKHQILEEPVHGKDS